MTYDLIVFPVDRALTFEEAATVVSRFGGFPAFRLGHDKRLDPFIAALGQRYPGLRDRRAVPPFEFDLLRTHIFIGIPWSMIETVTRDVAEVAWATGLAVFDPQREAVGLPAPFAAGPLSSEGIERHVASATDALAAIRHGAEMATGDDPADLRRAISGQLAAAGYRTMSPLGFEVTPDVEGEAMADPTRVPTSLQTPERRVELIAALGAAMVGDRHRALIQLAGWDPDPAVAAALRPILASDDVFEAGQAASGLARQADLTDLPAVLDLVHRLSPADGGSTEAMLIPLRAALSLAALGGSMATDGVKARARTWRGEPKVRRQSWEREFDRELDELLSES